MFVEVFHPSEVRQIRAYALAHQKRSVLRGEDCRVQPRLIQVGKNLVCLTSASVGAVVARHHNKHATARKGWSMTAQPRSARSSKSHTSCSHYTQTAASGCYARRLYYLRNPQKGAGLETHGGTLSRLVSFVAIDSEGHRQSASSRRTSPSSRASSIHTSCRFLRLSPRFVHICLLLFFLPFDRQTTPQEGLARTTATYLGAPFASAALCGVNVCENGICYENSGLQVCVCNPPYSGPKCENKISLCTQGCGIRKSTGIDCGSALCSLGTCLDSPKPPYFECDCGDFFTGPNCGTHNNPCTNPAANPCGQGTCTFAPGKGSGTVTCTCYSDYEAAAGAGVTVVKWGNSEVIHSPPCTVRKSRGIAKLHVNFSSGELVVWWAVFGIAIVMLIWCCYTVCTESCGRWALRAARAVKGVTG